LFHGWFRDQTGAVLFPIEVKLFDGSWFPVPVEGVGTTPEGAPALLIGGIAGPWRAMATYGEEWRVRVPAGVPNPFALPGEKGPPEAPAAAGEGEDYEEHPEPLCECCHSGRPCECCALHWPPVAPVDPAEDITANIRARAAADLAESDRVAALYPPLAEEVATRADPIGAAFAAAGALARKRATTAVAFEKAWRDLADNPDFDPRTVALCKQLRDAEVM
jgi:hypothetical protein